MDSNSDYEIRWKNYRAFEDTGQIAIRPLTILIGANNSGKSSIIGPLLLLSQTMSSRDSVIPLVTRGELVDAGHYKDIVHNHDTSKALFFALDYERQKPVGKLKEIGSYPPGAAEITLTSGDRPEDILLSRFEAFDVHRRPFFHQIRNANGTYSVHGDAIAGMKPHERKAIIRSKPVNFLFSSSAVLNEILRERKASTDRQGSSVVRSSSFSNAFAMYISAMSYAFEALKNLLLDLSYIGPLRDRLKRYYEIAGEMPDSIGSRGEHMATLLRRRLPQLGEELNKWIGRFGFGSKMVLKDFSDELFSLSFESTRPTLKTNITDAGFGASQVLPLVVQVLTAEKGTLTIAEQPEIHLNPRLQSLLADLFVQMANGDHRLIVETHSEHLLLRLRGLVAGGEIEHNKVAIYFVSKEKGVSTVKEIRIQKDGHISPEEWPEDFFQDSLRGSLALAAAQQKSARSR